MDNYLDYAKRNKRQLLISTANNKQFRIMVEKFDVRKVQYINEYGYKGAILKEHIKKICFANPSVEKEFITIQNNISTLTNYYLKCLNNEKDKIPGKEQLFETMFNSLYQINNDNLLFKFFTKNDDNIMEKYMIYNPILIQNSNISQRQAIKNALNYKISIIEGPPGTGKTTTILSIIVNLIKQNKKVVVVSKNNTAVDNIIEEFKKTNLPEFYIRFGKKEIMDDLKNNVDNKINNLKFQLNQININNEDLIKFEILKNKLNILEPQINNLIDLKCILTELKIQKKFIDKQINAYELSNYINTYQHFLNNKNIKPKKLNKLIKIINKEKYNILDILYIKTKYKLNIKTDKKSLIIIFNLLKQLYLNEEIKTKEEILENGHLEDKQQEVEQIYKEYVSLSTLSFKNALKNNIKFYEKGTIQKAFNTFPLILTTADGFLFNVKNFLKRKKQLDCIIIDEATQCDVIAGLPLLFLAKKIIVVGDSKQLSAITDSIIDDDIEDIYEYQNNNFLKAVKEVFDPPSEMLKEHYRCDYNIINFCNKYYYDNQLKIYKSRNKNAMSIINVNQYKGVQIENSSFFNEREIKTLNTTINSINNCFIITPFREQANRLKKVFNNSSCGTIHSFQGKGADNVYFSTVLNDFNSCKNHIKGPNNLFTKELINVAVSRAKNKFILVGDKDFFEQNGKYTPDLKNLIDYISIYGNEIEDKSVCIFDYLYKNIKYYKSTKIFDNQYEESLYYAINDIIEDTSYKCYPKLFLIDLVTNSKFLQENPNIKQYILNGAHADFTIIDKRINKPVVVIELDGKYHSLKVQKIRDEYKNKAIEASGIGMLRIPSKSAIDVDDLKNILLDKYNLELD